MPTSMFDLLNNKRLWSFVLAGSSIVGICCFTLTSIIEHRIEEWGLLILFYGTYGLYFGFATYFPDTIIDKPLETGTVIMWACVFGTLAFLSCRYDQCNDERKSEMGYTRILSLISLGAFTLASLSLLLRLALELKLRRMLGFLSNAISNIINHTIFWRLLGSGSSMVGFSCCALSPTFEYMIGEWNWWKIAIYITASSVFLCILLFVKELGSRENFISKANACFLVFLGNCVYSYYQDKIEGKNESDHGRMLTMFSFGGFAFMSLSLSRRINIGFEMGLSTFFLTGFSSWAMKMNLLVKIAAALICYVYFYIWSY